MASLACMVLGCLLGSTGGETGALVYKCQTAGGHSYQSSPCEGLELKRWSTVDAPTDETVRKRLAAIELQLQLQRDRLSTKSGVRPGRRRAAPAPKANACENARRGRDRAYAKAGLKRDFALSSFWDNKVHQACR